MSWITHVLVAILFSTTDCAKYINEENSRVENTLETEIDLRLPSSFLSYKYLHVRPSIDSNYTVSTYNKGTDSMETYTKLYDRNNWEVFAKSYWFETRAINASCPQVPQGIAVVADWALMIPCMFGNPSIKPRIVYVHTYMLPHFIESTFHFTNKSDWKFVLISSGTHSHYRHLTYVFAHPSPLISGTDQTIPYSTGDLRPDKAHPLRNFPQYYEEFIQSPNLIHWFAENKDTSHPKLSSLPHGLSVPDYSDEFYAHNIPVPHTISLLERPLKVLVTDRVRDGSGQWKDRNDVSLLCSSAPYCLQPNAGFHKELGVGHLQFLVEISQVPFILCTHGGGIDPSPKAFEAILVGTIPIIQHSTLDDAYRHLPVVFVDSTVDLLRNNNTLELLMKWRAELSPYYEEGSELREKVKNRLTLAYWNEQINKKIREPS